MSLASSMGGAKRDFLVAKVLGRRSLSIDLLLAESEFVLEML